MRELRLRRRRSRLPWVYLVYQQQGAGAGVRECGVRGCAVRGCVEWDEAPWRLTHQSWTSAPLPHLPHPV